MEYDDDLAEILQEAVDRGDIEKQSPGYGVALQLMTRGYDSLSDDQKFAYQKHIVPHLESIQKQRDVNARISGMPE
jgi:hypothetical protein